MIQLFANSTTSVTRIMFDCTLHFPSSSRGSHPSLIQEHKESRCMLGSFGMTKSHLRVLTMFWHATATIILIHQFVLKPRLCYNSRTILYVGTVEYVLLFTFILTIRIYVIEYVCTTLQCVTLSECIKWYLLYIWYFFSLKNTTWFMMLQVVLEGLAACRGFTSL